VTFRDKVLHAQKKIFGASSETSRQIEGQISLFGEEQLLSELAKKQEELAIEPHIRNQGSRVNVRRWPCIMASGILIYSSIPYSLAYFSTIGLCASTSADIITPPYWMLELPPSSSSEKRITTTPVLVLPCRFPACSSILW